MRHIIRGFVFILSISIIFPLTYADASSGDTYEVSPEVLHVRDEPAKDGNIVGILQKGDKVAVFSEKYGWAQTYYAGEVAWVAKHHIYPTGASAETTSQETNETEKQNTNSTGSTTITHDDVIIRSGPGQNHEPIASTSSGRNYTVLGSDNDWINIQLSNGNTGWVANWLTSESTESSSPSSSNNTEEVAETVTQTTNTDSNLSLAGYNIVIDAGHGGRDGGASGLDGVVEKDLVTPTASNVANTLRSYGATVIETRTGDYYLPLDQRVEISNSYYTDAFISIHYDAFPVLSVQGVGTYYNSDAGRTLAQNVQQSIAAAVPLENRSIRQENFRVLRNTSAPAILIELGFITNPYDLSIIRTADYQNQVSEAIANGLMNYFHR